MVTVSEKCYANETNITLVLNESNISYPGSIPALTHFLYYNPIEDNGTVDGEGNYSFPTPITSPITISSLPIKNLTSSFPADPADADGNGTTHIEYKLNFDRKQNLLVNPFQLVMNEANITEMNVTNADGTPRTLDDLVEGDTGTLTDQNATMYYAKASSSKFFYEDIIEDTAATPITVNIYCDFNDYDDCEKIGINIDDGRIDDMYWWLSLGHNETAHDDGNITLKINLPNAIIEGNQADTPTVDTDVTVDNNGADDTIIVTSNASKLPMTVIIDLDESNPTDTNHWLIYNPYSASIAPTPFYKVRFIGDAKWAGEGQTGHVVDINASYKKSQRVDW